MSNLQRIGLYLTDQNIFLVEYDPKKLQKVVSSQITVSSADTPLPSDATEEIHIVGTFQKLLRENKIEPSNIYVSIPVDEVFLRSFVIPWMPTNELNNVVFYEAKKYVPFDLKLLDYVYQAFPFMENKQRRLRIIFYAIRKQTLEKYDRIFKQTSCRPIVYEPSLVSLAKQLVTLKQLRTDQKTVVIYNSETYGQIIFYEKGVAFFSREFPMNVGEVVHDSKAIPDVLRAQLLREVRKSFGYYSRQFSAEKIKEILIISVQTDQELVKTLTEEFSVKVRTMDASVSVNLQKVTGLEALCACGACLLKSPAGLPSFNFLQPKFNAQSQGGANALLNMLPPYFSQLLIWEKNDFLYAIQAFVVCSLLLGAGLFFSQSSLHKMQKQSEELVQKQGSFAIKSVEELNGQIQHNKDQIASYTKTMKDNSTMAYMTVHLTKALPKGVWLETISMTHGGNISLQGYVYTPVEGAQFKLIKEFMSHLKDDPNLSAIKFKLNTMQKQTVDERDAFAFSITGS
jgi:Tfp pilus assembly protein PilN